MCGERELTGLGWNGWLGEERMGEEMREGYKHKQGDMCHCTVMWSLACTLKHAVKPFCYSRPSLCLCSYF